VRSASVSAIHAHLEQFAARLAELASLSDAFTRATEAKTVGNHKMKRSTKTFVIGDHVAYSVAWLRSTGNIVGDLPFLRGTVRAIDPFGDNHHLVTIAWDNYKVHSEYHDDGLGRVISANLTLVSKICIDSALNT
jgi:hypothetical protein